MRGFQDCFDLDPGQHHWKPFWAFGSSPFSQVAQGLVKDIRIEKDQGIEGLILRGRRHLAFGGDGRLVVGHEGGALSVSGIDNTLVFEAHLDPRDGDRFMAVPPGGAKAVLAGGDGGRLALWDLASGQEGWPSAGHVGAVTAVAFADGVTVFSGGADGRRLGWDMTSGEVVDVLERVEGPIHAMCGTFAAAGTELRILNEGSDLRMTMTGLPIHSIVPASGGRFVLTSEEDGTTAVWDLTRPIGPGGEWQPAYGITSAPGHGQNVATLVDGVGGLLLAVDADVIP